MQFCRVVVVNRLARENKQEKEDFELGTCVKTANICLHFFSVLPVIVSDYC